MRQAARRIVEKLRLRGHEAFFAGGWVRDHLLRRKPKDVDIATSALPDEVIRLFPNSKPIGVQFGVIHVPMYGRIYEVATFRSDSEYHDGRHPVSVTFSGPEQDALRRDFTVNGLFFDPVTGRVIDYVRGRRDVRDRKVRTIGNPLQRFNEDKLRMLRAIRIACDLNFAIVPETWGAILELAPAIVQVSWERIRDELARIFTGPDPSRGLTLLHGSGLLSHVLPEVHDMCAIPQLFSETCAAMGLLRNPSTALAFAALTHESAHPVIFESKGSHSAPGHLETSGAIAERICRRLKMSNDEKQQIVWMVESLGQFGEVPEMRESALKRFLRQARFGDLLELYRVHCVSGHHELKTHDYCRRKLREYGSLLAVAPLVTGEDLIRIGYLPGPVFSEILRTVEDLQLEGTIRTWEEAIAYIEKSFAVHKPTLKPEA